MKALAFIAVLFFPVLSFSTLGDETCETAIAKSAIDAVKSEIAALLIEKSKAGSGSPLKSLLNTNIANKIQELEAILGRPVDKKELAALVHEREGAEEVKQEERKEIENKSREREKDMMAVKETKFEMDLGPVAPLDDSYLHQLSGGVQWTRDDHYVHIRNDWQKSWIYDLVNGKFVEYHPSNGFLSTDGHFYNERKPEGIYIRNLDNQESWGPFPGRPDKTRFNAHSIVVTGTDPSTGGDVYFCIDFRTNRKTNLGMGYNMTEAGDVAAVKEGENTRVIDLKTGITLKSYPSHNEFLSDFPPGAMWYQREGQKFLVRLSDRKEFPFKHFGERASGLSQDGTKLVLKLNSNSKKRVVIHDLITGSTETVEGFSGSEMSEDKTKVLIFQPYTNRSVVVDLQTMQKTEIPFETSKFSPNGRWVYHQVSTKVSIYHFDLFDLVNGKKISFDAGLNFDFLGQANYFTTSQTLKQDTPAEIYVNDAANWPGSLQGLQIGSREGKPSSTGRYFVTRAGDKIKLLEVGLVPKEGGKTK